MVAETFAIAWRRVDQLPAGDDARPWLFGVARNVLANHLRGERRRHRLAERLRDELSTWTAPPADIDPRVADAFATLSPKDREVLSLNAWEEFEPNEIAGVLGITTVAARTRLHRARARMRRALDDAESDTDRWVPAATLHRSGSTR